MSLKAVFLVNSFYAPVLNLFDSYLAMRDVIIFLIIACGGVLKVELTWQAGMFRP